MKFNISVEINEPLEKVVNLWNQEKTLHKWQDGYLGSEIILGNPGEEGTKTKMSYQIGNKKMDLMETVLMNDLPHEFLAKYEAKTMTNTMRNSFKSITENTTRWEATIHYTAFNGLTAKLMALLMPGMFRKKSQKWLNQFKEFAEKS